jgi:hypothetical protein
MFGIDEKTAPHDDNHLIVEDEAVIDHQGPNLGDDPGLLECIDDRAPGPLECIEDRLTV